MSSLSDLSQPSGLQEGSKLSDLSGLRGISIVDQGPRDGDLGAGGADQGPTVVLVHGSLDRAQSFQRVARRLEGVRVLSYDRRGYGRSRVAGGPLSLEHHVEDLVAIARTAPSSPVGVVAVGHSFGGLVVMGAALRAPELFGAIGAYEPPMAWFGFRRPPGAGSVLLSTAGAPGGDPQGARRDPTVAAKVFFCRMVGQEAWERLSAAGRAERQADGPALVGDLAAVDGPAHFVPAALRVPAVFGRGGTASRPHHRAGVAWLAQEVPGGHLYEIPGASHGAHLTHPEAFAAMVRFTVARAPDRAPLGAVGREWSSVLPGPAGGRGSS